MTLSDWVVSSRLLDTQPITVNGNPANVTFPSGGGYLAHTSSSLSILARLELAMTAGGVVGASARVSGSRRVLLSGTGAWSLTWGASTGLRDLLGFAGDLAAASSYLAPSLSTLLWSPGKRLKPMLSPLDTLGKLVLDVSATKGEGGQQTVRREGGGTTVQLFEAEHVYLPRFWQTKPAAAAGEFRHFWENELALSRRVVILREVDEDDADDAAADYSTAVTLGPYVADMGAESMQAAQFARSTGFELVERAYGVSLPVMLTSEVGA